MGPEASPPRLSVDGPVATITLNRPAHRNRLHDEDLQALLAHFAAIDADPALRVVVLTGAVLPERPVFCAGYHLGEQADLPTGDRFEQVADALERLRPVTVAAVNGNVYGGATDLVLACDFALGVEGLEMRMPALALGLHYYPGGIARYVSRLGVVNAKRAFLGADTWSDRELLALAPMAQQLMKRSLNEVARGSFDAERLRARLEATQRSEDFAEGTRAFAERRAPRFKGR